MNNQDSRKVVEIPKSLAEKVDPLGAHFCLVAPKDKNPNVGGKGWQKPENLMRSTDPKLTDWLAKGGNYGVVGGFGLVILDADIPEIKRLIEEKLPSTFTVESPGSQGRHAYYLCGLEKPIRLRDKEGENVGDIQGTGKMCVGPGSIHPNGGVYEIVADVPLAQVTTQQLIEALKPYVVPEREIQRVEETARREKRETDIKPDILQVVPLTGLHKHGDEYYGPHPVHGSQHGKNGKNFWVNPAKNCWHCFRHDTGGGPLLWLAVEEGIINCSEAGPRALRGEVFKRVLEKAVERGYIDAKQVNIQKYTRTGTPIGNYWLKKKHKKVFLVDEDNKPVLSCNLDSVDGPRFKKKLRELTGLEEAEVNRATTSFSFAVQSIRKSHGHMEKNEEAEKEEPKFSEDVEANITVEVERVLEAEKQLEMLKPHLDNVVVGEESNKQAIFVLLTSGKYAKPEMKQMILLKGTAAGGKSTLSRELTRGYKTKNVGRFTAHALDYADLEGSEVLVLKELGAMDKEDTEKRGLSTLKFLSSDDRGYTVEMPVRDEETGRFKNTQYKIPAITIISTTTRLTLDPQFERRTWLFNVDETVEQTKKIAFWKAQNEKQKTQKLLGLRQYTDYEFSKEVLKRFVEKLEPINVIIPFPETLTEILGYNILRVRGDLDKVYNFLKFYGLFNKKRLQQLNENVYVLTPEICVEAIELIVEPLTNMLSQMDERAKAILEALKKVSDVTQRKTADGETVEVETKYCLKGSEITKKVRDRITVEVDKSERTVRNFFNFLSNTPFVSSDGKKPITYTLLVDVETIEQKLSGILEKLKTSNLLIPEMEKEAQKLLNSLLENKTLREGYNFVKKNVEHDVEQHIESEIINPYRREMISNRQSSLNQASLAETSSEDWKNKKLPIIQRDKPKESWILKREGNKITAKDGNVLFVCPLCATHGKQLFFNSQSDLDLHIQGLHYGYPIKKGGQ